MLLPFFLVLLLSSSCSSIVALLKDIKTLSVVGPLFFISFTVYGIVSVFALRAHKKGTKGASVCVVGGGGGGGGGANKRCRDLLLRREVIKYCSLL